MCAGRLFFSLHADLLSFLHQRSPDLTCVATPFVPGFKAVTRTSYFPFPNRGLFSSLTMYLRSTLRGWPRRFPHVDSQHIIRRPPSPLLFLLPSFPLTGVYRREDALDGALAHVSAPFFASPISKGLVTKILG